MYRITDELFYRSNLNYINYHFLHIKNRYALILLIRKTFYGQCLYTRNDICNIMLYVGFQRYICAIFPFLIFLAKRHNMLYPCLTCSNGLLVNSLFIYQFNSFCRITLLSLMLFISFGTGEFPTTRRGREGGRQSRLTLYFIFFRIQMWRFYTIYSLHGSQ